MGKTIIENIEIPRDLQWVNTTSYYFQIVTEILT